MTTPQRTEPRTSDNGPDNLTNRLVVVRQPAMMKSPKTGEDVYVRDVSQVLLAPGTDNSETDDDDIAYECNICGELFASARGGASHLRAHSGKPSVPRYPIEQVKLIIRLVKMAERDHHPDPYQYATDEFNRRGFVMKNGQPWIRASVYDLYRRWSDMIRVKVPSTRKSAIGVTETDIAETDIGDVDTASVSAIDVAINITKAMDQTAFTLQKLLDAFQGIEPALTALVSAVADAGAVDDSVKDKARRWDEMQRLFAK